MGCAKWRCLDHVIVAVALWTLYKCILNGYLSPETNKCEMTFLNPSYVPIAVDRAPGNTFPSHYKLIRYVDGSIVYGSPINLFDGTPVLFIPGNAGSAAQVFLLAFPGLIFRHSQYQIRSLGAVSALFEKEFARHTTDLAPLGPLSFFAIDFGEELSALSGAILARQSLFAAHAAATLLSRYGLQLALWSLHRPQYIPLDGSADGQSGHRPNTTTCTRSRYVQSQVAYLFDNTVCSLKRTPHPMLRNCSATQECAIIPGFLLLDDIVCALPICDFPTFFVLAAFPANVRILARRLDYRKSP